MTFVMTTRFHKTHSRRKKNGIAAGFFYSVHANWAKQVCNFHTHHREQEEYNLFVLAQLQELYDNYNDINPWVEIWFDGGYGGDVHPKMATFLSTVYANATCHSCGNKSANCLRWMGNEEANMSVPNWDTVNPAEISYSVL